LRAARRSGGAQPHSDEQFVADLAHVVNGTVPAEYGDAPTFFRHSYATRGMKDLLKAVCSRLTGHGGEIGSIIRLHTQYGGGKTHGFIPLVHAARGMKGVPNPGDFVSPDLIPSVPVRVAALDAALELLRRLAFANDVPPPPDLPEQFSLALEEE
jgi:hypothetical protein